MNHILVANLNKNSMVLSCLKSPSKILLPILRKGDVWGRRKHSTNGGYMQLGAVVISKNFNQGGSRCNHAHILGVT